MSDSRETGGKSATGETDNGSRFLEPRITLFPPVSPVPLVARWKNAG
jgi:hypothetical protein